MEYALIVAEVLKLGWVIPILVLGVILGSPWFKGLIGEWIVRLAGQWRLPADTYHAFHNVTLPTADGTTQIDHLYVSRFGVFVVETKHMKGWIFGTEQDAQWTQNIFGRTFKFQNPLRQNYKHVKALEAILCLPADAIHSVVVFSGRCTLKSPLPANVRQGIGYLRYIQSFREPVLSDEQVNATVTSIQSGRLSPTWATHRRHVQSLKSRHAGDAERSCQQCGSPMVLRTAKQGANAGGQFWGCTAYPRCKGVQRIT